MIRVSVLLTLSITQLQPMPETRPGQLWQAFADGDLVTVVRGLHAQRLAGVPNDLGSLGLLRDFVDLVRCRTLGPIPTGEGSRYRPARIGVRLARARLLRHLNQQAYESSAEARLVRSAWAYETRPAKQPELVHWPVSTERWPLETEGIDPAASQCRRPDVKPAAIADRGDAELPLLELMLQNVDALPDAAVGPVLLTYAKLASKVPPHAVDWSTLERALGRSTPPYRTANLVELGRLAEARANGSFAERCYQAVLADPTSTAAQASRVRVRLLVAAEPDWTAVEKLSAVSDAKFRPEDLPIAQNAHARALLALSKTDALMALGRRWLLRTQKTTSLGRFDLQTQDLLLRLGMMLPPAEAIAWIEELGPRDYRRLRERLATLASLAIEAKRYPLAVMVIDRLRIDAASRRKLHGPRAASEQARWMALRASIEFERGDLEAFADYLYELEKLARAEAGRPLARFAAHKALSRLNQSLLGRIREASRTNPKQRRFAAELLRLTEAIIRSEGRPYRGLRDQPEPLRILAGGLAPQSRAALAKRRARRRAPVRLLGEVVLPRLPPRLEAPDVPSPSPTVDHLLLYETPSGDMKFGAPWDPLIAAKELP